MTIDEQRLRAIIREEFTRLFAREGIIPPQQVPSAAGVERVDDADEELMSRAMEAMDASLEKQNHPKVGIFWYSPLLHDLFGVVAIDAKTAPKSGGGLRTCIELHKTVWKKNYNYNKFHNIDSPFQGDYKNTPRGRIFYDEESDEYNIMIGKWIETYPDVIQKVKETFNLTDPNLCVHVKRGIHWEIGMGYGD